MLLTRPAGLSLTIIKTQTNNYWCNLSGAMLFKILFLIKNVVKSCKK